MSTRFGRKKHPKPKPLPEAVIEAIDCKECGETHRVQYFDQKPMYICKKDGKFVGKEPQVGDELSFYDRECFPSQEEFEKYARKRMSGKLNDFQRVDPP